jgi:hypothetical protein
MRKLPSPLTLPVMRVEGPKTLASLPWRTIAMWISRAR